MFWYYVAPYTEKTWNILFENQPKPYIYQTEEDAVTAAREVAKDNFEKHGKPTGVRIKVGDRWRTDATFGED